MGASGRILELRLENRNGWSQPPAATARLSASAPLHRRVRSASSGKGHAARTDRTKAKCWRRYRRSAHHWHRTGAARRAATAVIDGTCAGIERAARAAGGAAVAVATSPRLRRRRGACAAARGRCLERRAARAARRIGHRDAWRPRPRPSAALPYRARRGRRLAPEIRHGAAWVPQRQSDGRSLLQAATSGAWRVASRATTATDAASAALPPQRAQRVRGCAGVDATATLAAIASRNALRETTRQHDRCRTSTHHFARKLPALPAFGQFAVVLQAPQQEPRLVGRERAVHQRGKLLPVMQVDLVDDRPGCCIVCLIAHRLTRSRCVPVSSNGRSSTSIASRARKMRERTVPIGHCIRSAISS